MYKRLSCGTKSEVPEPGSGLDLRDHLIVVRVLLLVDVDPAWGYVRRPVPTPSGHVDAPEDGVVMHAVHRFRTRQPLNFLARQAVVHRHFRRNSRADK